jgi:hypothetical protein
MEAPMKPVAPVNATVPPIIAARNEANTGD